LKLREPKGVLIRSVMPGEPADQGGVKPNDVIVALDGTPLDGPRDLQRVVASTPVGKKVRVTVLRGGREQQLDVTIGRYKAADERRREEGRWPAHGGREPSSDPHARGARHALEHPPRARARQDRTSPAGEDRDQREPGEPEASMDAGQE